MIPGLFIYGLFLFVGITADRYMLLWAAFAAALQIAMALADGWRPFHTKEVTK